MSTETKTAREVAEAIVAFVVNRCAEKAEEADCHGGKVGAFGRDAAADIRAEIRYGSLAAEVTAAIEARGAEHLANYLTPEEKAAVAAYTSHLEALLCRYREALERIAELADSAASYDASKELGETGNIARADLAEKSEPR